VFRFTCVCVYNIKTTFCSIEIIAHSIKDIFNFLMKMCNIAVLVWLDANNYQINVTPININFFYTFCWIITTLALKLSNYPTIPCLEWKFNKFYSRFSLRELILTNSNITFLTPPLISHQTCQSEKQKTTFQMWVKKSKTWAPS
jgi:hypothetical protein